MPKDIQSHREQQTEGDQQFAEASEQSAGLTRRQLLRSATVALLFSLSPQAVKAYFKRARIKGRKHWPKPPRGVRNPRFVHKKSVHKKRKVKAVAVSLSPGFYLNPRSQVIHYVSSNQKIARVNKINERRLQPLKPFELTRLMGNGSKPRINLSTASHSLEIAALSSLRSKDYGNACQLLVSAIRHDQFFKQATLQPPSLRLYDLLAGGSVRFGQEQHFDQ